MGTKRQIEVAAAVIFRDGKLLITQRHADAHLGGLWEFPGGKREAGETFEECVVRELREELGVAVEPENVLETITHEYPEKMVHLRFILCRIIEGQPQPVGCSASQWVSKSELDNYAFPAADVKLLGKLRESSSLWQPDVRL